MQKPQAENTQILKAEVAFDLLQDFIYNFAKTQRESNYEIDKLNYQFAIVQEIQKLAEHAVTELTRALEDLNTNSRLYPNVHERIEKITTLTNKMEQATNKAFEAKNLQQTFIDRIAKSQSSVIEIAPQGSERSHDEEEQYRKTYDFLDEKIFSYTVKPKKGHGLFDLNSTRQIEMVKNIKNNIFIYQYHYDEAAKKSAIENIIKDLDANQARHKGKLSAGSFNQKFMEVIPDQIKSIIQPEQTPRANI